MLRSFKWKMALFSVLVAGVVLTLLASFSVSAIRRIGIERIDHELQALGDAQVRRLQPRDHWRRFDANLADLYGEGNRIPIAFKVNETQGRRIYASPNWPLAISGETLGFPDRAGGPVMEPPRPPPPRPGGPNPPPRPVPEVRVTPPRFLTAMGGGRNWRLVILGNEDINLVIGQDLAAFHNEIQAFRNVILTVMLLALLLLVSGGWWLAVRALRSVNVLAQVAGDITAKGLDRRVPIVGADREFTGLIEVINGMLDRLERSFRQAARFSADAAHEFKTPLTILQGQLELAMRAAPVDSDEQRRYAGLLEEVERLKGIVRKLLLLAQADSGQLKLGLEPLDLSREVESLYGDAQLLAPGLTLHKDIAAGIRVMADPDLLRQAMRNLMSNAIAYNRENGSIGFGLCREERKILFVISNTTASGTRLNPDRLFERFYRGDTAHSRQVDGVGLGLSLAREITRAHGGDLRLGECREDWVAFELWLPAISDRR